MRQEMLFFKEQMSKFIISNLLQFYIVNRKKDITKYETISMIGYFKLFEEEYQYNINAMTDIFVTKKEYFLTKIKPKFEIVEVYFVNPKLLLANLDYIQKVEKYITKFPPPFIFKVHIGKYVSLNVHLFKM